MSGLCVVRLHLMCIPWMVMLVETLALLLDLLAGHPSLPSYDLTAD